MAEEQAEQQVVQLDVDDYHRVIGEMFMELRRAAQLIGAKNKRIEELEAE